MAHSALKGEKAKREYFDPPEVLEEKLDLLASWVRESEHAIAFTGAGISTSAGIPDFRSGMGTVLTTGPGVWELRAAKQARQSSARVTDTRKAIPTPTHMSLVALEEQGILKFLVSQNTDGLHRRSGFNPKHLAELHGNSNLEYCKKCRTQYLRDFRCRSARGVKEHFTGRYCSQPGCGGKLYDSIINFGENLPEKDINAGFEHAERADLCLAMGSSLTVTPAANIPERVAERGKRLVIVNLQKTPLHSDAALVIHAMCDTVMSGLMQRLGMEIPTFKLKRHIHVAVEVKGDAVTTEVQGVDDGVAYSLFPKVQLAVLAEAPTMNGVLSKKTWERAAASSEELSHRFTVQHKGKSDFTLAVLLHFMGHYKEVPLVVLLKPKPQDFVLHVALDPMVQHWTWDDGRSFTKPSAMSEAIPFSNEGYTVIALREGELTKPRGSAAGGGGGGSEASPSPITMTAGKKAVKKKSAAPPSAML